MKLLKAKLQALLANDAVRRVLHTFYQAAGGVLLAQLLVAHSGTDVKGAVIAAGAAGIAAVRLAFVASR